MSVLLWASWLPPKQVSVTIESKRKNVKGITCESVAQVHHDVHTEGASYAVVTLKDRRVVFLTATHTLASYADTTAITATECTADVSHDLELLWWYGLTQAARDAFAAVGS